MSAARNVALGALTAFVAAGGVALHAWAQKPEQVIKVVAKRFDYTPGQITLHKGVPVVLELTSEDVIMGFSAPDFATRADIVPGKVARVRIVPDKTGSFTFVCDIFCGVGHEQMEGTIRVVD